MKTIRKTIQNIVWLMTPYWKYGKCFFLFGIFYKAVAWPLITLLEIYMPQIVVDALLANQSLTNIALIIAFFSLIAYLLKMVENFYCDFYSTVRGEKIQIRIQRNIFEKAQATDYKYIDNPAFYNDYSLAVRHYASKADEARELLSSILRGIVAIILFSTIIATVTPWVVLVVVVYACVRLAFNFYTNRLEIQKEQSIVPYQRRLDYIHRLFYMKEYAADLRATKLGRYAKDSYDNSGIKKIGVLRQFARKTFSLLAIQSGIYRFSLFLIMFLIVLSFSDQKVENAGMFITLFLAADQLDTYLYGVFDMISSAEKLSSYAEKIRAFFERPSEIEQVENDAFIDVDETNAPEMALPFSITFRDVSFRYTKSDPYVLRHFSLSVNAGEKIAIVGENGVGKSTLVKLILRFYDIDGGEILLNGINIRDYNVHDLRGKIGVAFQNTNVYAFSLASNIELNHFPPKKDNLQTILEAVRLSSVLEKSHGDTEVEVTREFCEDGIILSGGEIQKMGLARLFANPSSLLLLDEPSSALDPIAEYEMNRLLIQRAGAVTTLMIAHRLSTVREMDKIVLVANGQVQEEETHEQLMALRGKYFEMFSKQAEGYI